MKSKVKIIICGSNRDHSTYLGYIFSIFDQLRSVFLYLEVSLLEKPMTPKKIGEALKSPQRKFSKYSLFLQ